MASKSLKILTTSTTEARAALKKRIVYPQTTIRALINYSFATSFGNIILAMPDEAERNEKFELPQLADRITRVESINTPEQNSEHAEALSLNPDQFPSMANLAIPGSESFEPFQIVDAGKTIAASRQIEPEPLDSFNQGLLALPQGTTPEHLAQYQIEYMNRKAGSLEAASIMPATPSTPMLEGYVEKSQPNQENNEFYERMVGTLIGTVQGVGNIAINLAYIADFCAYVVIGDRERGSEMLLNFGKAIADIAMTGVKLFHAADNYLYDVGFEGDYSKPFKDISTVAHALNEEWQKLPPREQERIKAEIVTQLLADGLIGAAGAQSIGNANKFTEIIDAVAESVNKTLITSKEKIKRTATTLSNTIDELFQPIADTGTGIKMKVPKADDLTLKMEGQSGKAYRGDDNFKSKFDKHGYAKSHINEVGDLVPADVKGMFNDRPVDIMEHICDVYFREEKAHSPFTSLSICGESALFFGHKNLIVDLVALRDAIKSRSLIGTQLIEHPDLLNLIDKSHFDNHYKKMAKVLVEADKEMLVKGPIPARFLEIPK